MNIHKLGVSCAALAFVGAGLAVPAVAADSGQRALAATYGNCTELNRDYPHGVSDRKKPRTWWIRRGATDRGAYKPKLYNRVHSNLDRDNDHIACEK